MIHDSTRRCERPLATAALLVVLAGCNGAGPSPARPGEEEDVWGIRCVTLRGPNHVVVAKNYETALKGARGLRGQLVQVYHDDSGSTVYYGRYRRRYDVAKDQEHFNPAPLRDLDLIRQLSFRDPGTNRDVWPFRLASLDALPTSRIGDPAWDLAEANGYWTVHVGVFYNTDGMTRRKFAAVEYCKLLRAQGHEAYYHHGPVNSSVCVGLFPKDAIVEVTREDPFSGELRASERIVSQKMLDLLKKFPESLENGHRVYTVDRDPRTDEVISKIPIPSFAAKAPKAEQ